MSDSAAARAIIEEYVAACRVRSAERLKAIFHPEALMSGYLIEQGLLGTPQPFYEALEHAPADPPGSRYEAEITSVDVVGRIASVTLKERDFLGLDFTDFFHLMKLDGQWKIVSKTFTTR